MSFIELLKVCPEHAKKDEKYSLSNFNLAVIEAADPPRLHILIDLSQQIMHPIPEQTQTSGGLQTKNNYYFVVGSTDVTATKKMNLRDGYGGRNGIPSGTNTDKTFSVVLLKSDRESIKKIKQKFKSSLPKEMTDDELEFFRIALQDIVTYGDTCNQVTCSTFIRWNLGLIQLEKDDNIEPIPDQTDTKKGQSISRCSKNNYPMQQECWESTNPTPLKRNECSVKVDPLYTFKHGRSLQSSARYVIMNVRNFFTRIRKGTLMDY